MPYFAAHWPQTSPGDAATKKCGRYAIGVKRWSIARQSLPRVAILALAALLAARYDAGLVSESAVAGAWWRLKGA